MDLSASGSWSRGGLIGRQIGPYQVTNEIARGGQGVVLEVQHIHLGYRAALKLLTAVTPQGTARFQQEAELMARLDHPHIPKLRDHGFLGAVPFMALDLVDGPTLERALIEGLITREQAVEVIEIVAETLQDCHERGIVHRDLKPSNVVIGKDLTPWLLDFGLAKADQQDQSLSMTGEILGTPSFMAPEQCTGEVGEPDPRTDVYGLGALLYFALAGVPPFEGASMVNVLKKILEDRPLHPREYEPDTPKPLSDLCLQALAKDPAARPESAAAFAEALADWRRGLGRTTVSGPVRLLASLIVLSVLGLGVALVLRAQATPSPVAEAATPTARPTPPAPTPTAPPTPAARELGVSLPDPRYDVRWSLRVPDAGGRVERVGPWVVVRSRAERWAIRARSGEGFDLPPGRHASWDRGAQRLTYHHDGQVQALDPTRDRAPTALGPAPGVSGLATAGASVVIVNGARRVTCLRGGKLAWERPTAGRVDAAPLPLDLDGDGVDDHVLYGTAQGRIGLLEVASGARRASAQLPGPIGHRPFVVGPRSEGGAVPVLVVCADGHVARVDVGRSAIAKRRLVTLHHAVRAAPVLVRQGKTPLTVALGLGPWGLVGVKVDGTEVAWATPAPRRGAWATDLATTDLDRDAIPEVAATWAWSKRDTLLTIHGAEGQVVEEHAPPEGHRWRSAAGSQGVLVGVRTGQVEAWGLRTKRYESRPVDPSVARARFLIVAGAWSAARKEGRALKTRQGALIAGLARAGLEGMPAFMAIVQRFGPVEPNSELLEIAQTAQTALAQQVAMDRLRQATGGMMDLGGFSALPSKPGDVVSTRPLADPQAAALEVRLAKASIEARGFQSVAASADQAKFGRHTFNTRGWLGVRWQVARRQRYRLALRHATVGSFGWGFSAVTIKVDGKPVVPIWSAPRRLAWDSVDLPPLDPGVHRVVVEVHLRTATIYQLSGLRLAPVAD